MKRSISAAFIVVAVVVMGFDNESKYIENGRIVLDSPFDLKLGSTEYAKTFGSLIRTSAHADYDPGTMKTITNFHHHATAYLSTPYFGCDKVGLKFEGDDKILSWCYFSIGKTTSDNTNIMSYAECRAVLDKIVDDMNKRCGITMQCVGNKTERQAKESVRLKIKDYERRKEKYLGFDMSFVSFRAQEGSVVYNINGLINEKERCYISVSCCNFQAISSSSSSSYKPGDKIPVHTNATSSAIGRQVPPLRMEKGCFVIDSPFDLKLGSAEYAKFAGKAISSHLNVDVIKEESGKPDTVESNWTHYATARLSKPYFGFKDVSLSFYGADKRLEHYTLSSMRKLKTEKDCIDLVKKLAADLAKRYGTEIDAPEQRESAEDVAKRIDDDNSAYGFIHASNGYADSPVEISISAMVSRKMRFDVIATVSDRKLRELRLEKLNRRGYVSVSTNNYTRMRGTPGTQPSAAQKQRHEEAAGLRATVKRLFGFDLDSTNRISYVDWKNSREWRPLSTPVEGLSEMKDMGGGGPVATIPSRALVVRRAFESDVSAEELDVAAGRILARIESEYGKKIQSMKWKNGPADSGMPSWLKNGGTPTYGDMRASISMVNSNKTVFRGEVGDIRVEIKYHEPCYVKQGDRFSIAVKGAILVTFTQFPSMQR